jgi:hypothetical protein
MASLDEFAVLLGITRIDTHSDIPAIGNGCEPRVERGPKPLDGIRQWIAEILVLAASEAVPSHDDAAPKETIFLIQAGECLAFLRRQDAWEQRAPLLV